MGSDEICKETGINMEYKNQYNGKVCGFQLGGRETVVKSITIAPISKYSEMFPLTEENRERALKLDEIAKQTNKTWTDADNFTDSDFIRTVNEVYELILGKKDILTDVLGKEYVEKILINDIKK